MSSHPLRFLCKSLIIYCFAIVFAVPLIAADEPPLPELYLIENIKNKNSHTADIRDLATLAFDENGHLVKTKLVSQDQRFFGHFGGHQIIDDRYLVTPSGGVIDIPSRKVINNEEGADLLGIENGKVIYLLRNYYRESGYFTFDIPTRTLAPLSKPAHWALPGTKSPDGTMSVEEGAGGAIHLHKTDPDATYHLESRDEELKRAAKDPFSTGIGDKSYVIEFDHYEYDGWVEQDGSFLGFPLFWLDNHRIISQRSNGKLIILGIDGTVQDLLEIKKAEIIIGGLNGGLPRFYKDKGGRLIYSISDQQYFIDVDTRKATPMERLDIGHGFDLSCPPGPLGHRQIFYKGEKIGEWNIQPGSEPPTGEGVIAFIYGDEKGGLSFNEIGVALWTARWKKWETQEMWINDLVAWARIPPAKIP